MTIVGPLVGALLARFFSICARAGISPAENRENRPILEAACARTFRDIFDMFFHRFGVPFCIVFRSFLGSFLLLFCDFVSFVVAVLSVFFCYFFILLGCFLHAFWDVIVQCFSSDFRINFSEFVALLCSASILSLLEALQSERE